MNGEKSVSIVQTSIIPTQEPLTRAIAQLAGALNARNIQVQHCDTLDETPADDLCILIADVKSQTAQRILDAAQTAIPDTPESLALVQGKGTDPTTILACGMDTRGIVYASVADQSKLTCTPRDWIKK